MSHFSIKRTFIMFHKLKDIYVYIYSYTAIFAYFDPLSAPESLSALPSGDSGQQAIRVEADDSLAGQRTHGLPNITGNSGTNNRNEGDESKVYHLINIII